MGYIKCCVLNCEDKISTRHRFPNPKKDMNRFKKWLEIFNNPILFDMDPIEIYITKRVCHRHFERRYYSEGGSRLYLNSIPSLYLSENIAPHSGSSQISNNDAVENEVQDTEQDITVDLPQSSHQNDAFVKRSHINLAKKSKEIAVINAAPQSILKSVGVSVRKDITPRKDILYGAVKCMWRKWKGTYDAKQTFKRRLFEAEKFSKERGLEKNVANLNAAASQFIRCQIRKAGKTPKQHRFSNNEKIMALTLYKKIPKSYRFLSKIFALPSKSTLNNFLNEVDFEPGINMNIFESLRIFTEKLHPSNRYVSILFDEMSIIPSLNFNERLGHIEGFEDMGKGERSSRIADHALVFMIRGIKQKFKQPVCYVFSCTGGASYIQIKSLLKKIIEILIDIGLKPITTICDQATRNVRVLNSLISETKAVYLKKCKKFTGRFFEINSHKIYPIFDPPHLLKSIRNNLLTRNLFFKTKGTGKQKVAKWDHVKNVYENDNVPNTIDGLKALPHLTDMHIYEEEIKKRKVKCAAQVFSQRVASTMNLASKIDTNHILGEGLEDTAELLYFFDKLFDSVNGSHKTPIGGKDLRCGISSTSDHLQFWINEALPTLASMEFEVQMKNQRKRPPSLGNWMFTIRNIMKIWEVVQKEPGFHYLLGRHLNQDPLENMFGQVRRHGVLYVNPTPSTFIGIFKTVLINSNVAIHKSTFNCEDDECDTIFNGFEYLFHSKIGDGVETTSDEL